MAAHPTPPRTQLVTGLLSQLAAARSARTQENPIRRLVLLSLNRGAASRAE